MQDKEKIRKELLARRTRLTSDDVETRSGAIRTHLLSWLNAQAFDTVCLFQPFRNEPNLMPLLKSLKQRTLLPVVRSRTEMDFFQVDEMTPYAVSPWGIHEPIFGDADPVTPDANTLAVVPALAADLSGSRLGYGGGFYDRYFSRNPATLMVAVYDDFVMSTKLPHELHDIQVQFLLTESGVKRAAP